LSASFSHAPPSPQPYSLSLHDALPIFQIVLIEIGEVCDVLHGLAPDILGRGLEVLSELLADVLDPGRDVLGGVHLLSLGSERDRSEEHTSELQSRENLVCRLLLEKKNI